MLMMIVPIRSALVVHGWEGHVSYSLHANRVMLAGFLGTILACMRAILEPLMNSSM